MKKSKLISLLALTSIFTSLSSCSKNSSNPSSSTSSPISPVVPEEEKDKTTTADSFTYTFSSSEKGYIIINGLNNPNYAHIVIPDEIDGYPVKRISADRSGFRNNRNIKSIKFGKNITSIPDSRAFIGCDNLEKIEIDSENPNFYLKDNCIISKNPDSNERYTIPLAFNDFTLPEDLDDVYITDYAIFGKKRKVFIPANVKIIAPTAFVNLKNFDEVEVDEKSTTYKVINNCVYNSLALKIATNNAVIPTDSKYYIIDSYAFSGREVTSITIPENITLISPEAFAYCKNLEEFKVDPSNTKFKVVDNCLVYNDGKTNTVLSGTKKTTDIPSDPTITLIGKNAFNGIGAKEVHIHSNIKKFNYGGYAYGLYSHTFEDSEVEEVTFDDDVKLTDNNFNTAFFYATKLKRVDIPKEVLLDNSTNDVAHNGFQGCESLESVKLYGTISNLSFVPFKDCIKLINITFADSNPDWSFEDGYLIKTNITTNEKILYGYFGSNDTLILPEVDSIYKYAFYYNSKIKNITLSSKVKSIGEYAFAYSSLENFNFNDEISTMGMNVFSNCKNLDNFKWTKNIVKIPSGTFSNSIIKNFYLPKNIDVYNNASAFNYLNIKHFEIESGSNYKVSDDGLSVTYSLDTTKLFLCFSDNNGVITIPEGVTEIEYFAGYGRNCKKIVMSNTVKKLNLVCFRGCKYLTEVKFSKNLERLEDWCFLDCYILKDFELPNSLKYIGDFMFSENYLKKDKFIIPESVEKIGTNSFYGNEIELFELKNPNVKLSVDSVQRGTFYCAKIEELKFYGTMNQFKTMIPNKTIYSYNFGSSNTYLHKLTYLDDQGNFVTIDPSTITW